MTEIEERVLKLAKVLPIEGIQIITGLEMFQIKLICRKHNQTYTVGMKWEDEYELLTQMIIDGNANESIIRRRNFLSVRMYARKKNSMMTSEKKRKVGYDVNDIVKVDCYE